MNRFLRWLALTVLLILALVWFSATATAIYYGFWLAAGVCWLTMLTCLLAFNYVWRIQRK